MRVVSKQISDLTTEVGQLAGTTQVIVTLMAGSRFDDQAKPRQRPIALKSAGPSGGPIELEAPGAGPAVLVPRVISTQPVKNAVDRAERLDQIQRQLEGTQQRVQQLQAR
jgi:hypothetical protein